jgi:HK97 family phage portal protein
MNWLQRVWNAARTSREKPDTSGSLCVNSTQAGIPIDDARALAYSSVWACVRVISETIAQLPWKTYQKAPRGKKDIAPEKNTVAWLLQMQPNPETTAFRWKRLMAAHVLTRGNAYSEIERDTQGRPLWLWPIDPDRVKPMRDDTGALAYEVRNANREAVIVPAADMLHFRGLGDNDTVGVSVIAKAKESIALGLAMERFGASFFGNGANLSGVVTHPGKLSPDAKTNIEESLKKRASGRNTLSTLVFEEGMKYEKIGIPPEDAQFLESRQFQVTEICRWFRVPPHKVQELSRATWNNIEHQSIEFVTDTIVPWTCNFEEEVNLKLFGRQNRGVYYTKFLLAALLRGDTASRFEAYSKGRQWGWLSVNDIRELEDLNGIGKNGDQYLVPTNMTTPEKIEQLDLLDPTPPDPNADPLKDRAHGRLLNYARTRR